VDVEGPGVSEIPVLKPVERYPLWSQRPQLTGERRSGLPHFVDNLASNVELPHLQEGRNDSGYEGFNGSAQGQVSRRTYPWDVGTYKFEQTRTSWCEPIIGLSAIT
jgi:hypothetical protein